jgi:hypothetical protein
MFLNVTEEAGLGSLSGRPRPSWTMIAMVARFVVVNYVDYDPPALARGRGADTVPRKNSKGQFQTCIEILEDKLNDTHSMRP